MFLRYRRCANEKRGYRFSEVNKDSKKAGIWIDPQPVTWDQAGFQTEEDVTDWITKLCCEENAGIFFQTGYITSSSERRRHMSICDSTVDMLSTLSEDELKAEMMEKLAQGRADIAAGNCKDSETMEKELAEEFGF